MLITGTRPFLFFFHTAYIAEIKVYGCQESDVQALEALSTEISGQTGTQAKQQTPDTQEKVKRILQPRAANPGRPGRPVFILDGKP